MSVPILVEGQVKYLKTVSGDGSLGDPWVAAHDTPRFIANESNVVSAYLENGGSRAQNVDGSVTAVEFSYTPPTGHDFLCQRAMIYMEDSTNFASGIFAGLGGALTNGWLMKINGFSAFTARDNAELAIHMFDISGNTIFGKDNQTLIGRFSFNKFTNGGDGITIRDGMTISTVVQDDLSGLDRLNVMVQGVLLPI